MEALRNFPHMINLFQGNKYRQRYRVYLPSEDLVRELFETKSNNLSISKMRTRRGLMKELNFTLVAGWGRVYWCGWAFVCYVYFIN
jgi:hypothetical protein